jgi:outer membrane protein assembly factor BamE (lipoprotein component of BamABCDE complex)
MKLNLKHLALVSCLTLGACTPASQHAEQVRANDSDRISVGKVQREIRVGMTSADVVASLGSPNIVTTDDQRREQWVYDKIATETVHSSSSGGVSALILGFSGNFAGAPGGGYNKSTGAKSTSQRTLTIIVKFDKESKVRDFAYHNSSF